MGSVFGRISEETPKYDVLEKDIGNGVTVRKYAPVYVAKCVSSDFAGVKTREQFNSAAFRVLAKYIGVFTKPRNTVVTQETQNGEKIAMTAPVLLEKMPMTAPVVLTEEQKSAGEKIKMTAPVLLDKSEDSVFSMAFILPSKYIENSKQPPVPTDSRVKIEPMPSKVVAVKVFSGYLMSSKGAAMKQLVLEEVKKSDYEMVQQDTDSVLFEELGYNAPFVLPMFRTNEVALPLKPKD